jgi:hypothetical protein
MQKHPPIKSGPQAAMCPFSAQLATQNLPVSPHAFGRHIRKANFTHSPGPGIRAYKLPCGCFVWQYASGARELSGLPF